MLREVPERVLCSLIRFYRLAVSPWKPRCCRFVPSCSEYGMEAVKVHGAVKGSCLIIWRLLRCHPFYRGSLYDPVPPAGGRKC